MRLFNSCGILCCALFLSSAALVSGCTENKAAAPPPPGVPVVVTNVLEKVMPIEVTSVGNVEPVSTVAIKAQVSGELLEVHFKEGDFVHKGQLLFTIDSRPFQNQVRQAQTAIAREQAGLQQAEANLARDKAQAEYANAQAQRYNRLTQRGLVPTDTSDQIRSQAAALDGSIRADEAAIESARANIKAQEGALEGAKLQLSYCTIYSPIDGRTGAIMLKAGNLVKIADAPMVVINQVDPIYVNFTVPQQYWGDVKTHLNAGGLKVRATAPQDPNPKQGRVFFVDNAVDPATGTLHIRAEFANAENHFLPGMFVNVVLRLSEQPNAKVVPSQAVTDGQNGTFVYVVKPDSTVETRPVVTTRSQDGQAVIEKGLEINETVVIDGQTRLTSGTKVQIKNTGK
jgi:multidrug efflux system membrane fusion protein